MFMKCIGRADGQQKCEIRADELVVGQGSPT